MRRSDHDLSFTHSTTFDMGQLVPIAAIDVLPGDTFRTATAALLRVSPQVNPVMHDVEVRIHNWFVPNRILWDDWEDFIVGNEGGATYPVITSAPSANELFDYMGAEPVGGGTAYDALPVRAYNLIYNERYRDQDLDLERDENDVSLARVRWAKDYFTTARPNPQQGEAIEVGFSSGLAPVGSPNGAQTAGDVRIVSGSDPDFFDAEHAPSSEALFANLANAEGGIDINEWRRAMSLQRIAEARQYFGSRYEDYLRWYGINPRDGRLDRPEFIGGGRQRVSFSEVLSTAETQNTEVGDLFGHGIAGVRKRPDRKMFEEHGWFISLAFVRPRGVYQTGIPKRFLRRQPTDFWHRELELLPWQEVKTREIFGGADAETTFGYVPRYDEYREIQNYVSGTMRGGTEEDWHLARAFSSEPTLNASFVECVPSDRIYQDAEKPEIIATFQNSIRGRRLVSANARMSNNAGI